jgi:NADH:ubiquinone oxidoreductase subunit E
MSDMPKYCSEDLGCDGTRAELLPVLQDIQNEKGFISDDNMQEVADKFGIHPVEVYSVIGFYSFLTTEKQGENVIRISNCVSSVMAGNKEVIKAFEDELGIKAGETTQDNKYTLEVTSCIGMCDKAPAIMLNDELIGNVTVDKVKEIVNK